MNKFLAWLPAVMVLGTVIYRPVKEATETKLVSKNLSFAVYKSSSYTSGAYDNTSAQVHIIVEKVNIRGTRTIVWDKTLDAKSLSQYPSIENALQQKITIANVNEKKEHLVVYYTLTYNSKGSELLMQEGIVVKDEKTSRVDISI
ncbi:MAG TPA: hypothetical protein VN958_22055 [Chitinophagaceae bacterium]|nr:hypothetical protein [Chitinophagaceae bacterium]